MAGHPFRQHRAHAHEKSRVSHLTGVHKEPKHYARGGSVHSDEAEDRAMIRKEVKANALKDEGKKAKPRADKATRRAKGGRVHKGKSAKTNVNVIVAPSGGAKPPMGAPMAGVAAPPTAMPPMPPKPPMAAPPAMAAPPPAGLGGLPPRANGGSAYKRGGAVKRNGMHADISRHMSGEKIETNKHRKRHGVMEMHGKRACGGSVSKDFGDSNMSDINPKAKHDNYGHGKPRASGGKVDGKKSMADKKGVTGIGERTPIQHSGNKSDTQNIGRGPVITRATGGPIYADGRAGHDMGPNLKAGANSGIGRRAKNKLARSQHWEA